MSGSTIEEYVEVTRLFDDSPIDAIEINISCPNVKEGGVAFGNYPEMSARVVEACRKATNKPIITKLSPNQTDIRENARRCIEAGSDGLAVINTIMGMAIDVKSRRPVIGNVQGGLSGPAIKPIALLKVHQVYEVAKKHNVPIIGQGGITTVNDALEFLIAGATTVGLGTALFYDPLLCRKINAGVADYLQQTTCEDSPTSQARCARTDETFSPCATRGNESILAPTRGGVAPDDGSGSENAHDDQNDVRRVVVTRTLDHDLGVLGALNDYFLHVSSLLRTSWKCPDPDGDKEWNKLGTLETKAFPIRDGNHVPLQLCHPLREFLWKKPEKHRDR